MTENFDGTEKLFLFASLDPTAKASGFWHTHSNGVPLTRTEDGRWVI
jgi:hypothetical protein